ncbi:heat shock protein 67B1-like [Leguminivora glycinivorella]|uniref:heat shock protein 67B1-like n=1 Tax=Leguminivora glycinivorella TaxID=1035111 RepID=UPI00200EBE82|nr:heat shock protein 67B1-like [Leguminivora glycinivorella]
MAFPPSLWPSRIFDQNFGMCITPNDFLFPFYTTYKNYYRPWKFTSQSVDKDFGSTINNEKESLKVTLDVQHFRPDELSVKVANKQIIVEGKHEERKDEHGFVSRHFMRRYALPSNCMPEDVISKLSSDGILTVVANKSKELPKNEQIVPITLCKPCPKKEEGTKSVINTDQKDTSAEIKREDLNKNNTQIMLKEDHCCLLLKPELLREAASESSETIEKKEKVDQDKLKTCQIGKNTSEMLEQTFAQANAAALASDEKCEKMYKSALSKSEIVEQKTRATTSDSGLSGERTSAAMSPSAEKLEQTFAKLSETSEEKFDLFDNTMTKSEEMLEQKFEKSSAAMSEKAGYSRMTKSEMSEVTSTSSVSECIESSTSYKASMTSNIQEISEELSDFVCDILSSELDKTLEIKK